MGHLSSHLPHINKNVPPSRSEAEKAADLEYEHWRQDMLYQIYGNQNPPTKTQRGRVF